MIRSLFLLLFILFSNALHAQDLFGKQDIKKRWVDLSWERIDGAKMYKLNLYKKSEDGEWGLYREYRKFDPEWSEELEPGSYALKMKSIDDRDVETKWGEMMPFEVKLPDPVLIYPYENDELQAFELESEKVKFQWKDVPGTVKYALSVWSEGANFNKTILTADTGYEMQLPTGHHFQWRIIPLSDPKTPLPPSTEGRKFLLTGGRLPPPIPKIDKSRKDRVTVNWTDAKNLNLYTLKIFKKEGDSWISHRIEKDYKSNKLAISTKRDGSYRFAIKTKKRNMQDSPYSFVELDLKEGMIISQKIQTQNPDEGTVDHNFYRIGAEYYSLAYDGEVYENDTEVKSTFNGVRLFGELFKKNFYKGHIWSLYGDTQILKSKDGNAYLYEISGVWGKEYRYDIYDFEYYAGMFVKSDLFIDANVYEGTSTIKNIQTAGPLLSMRGWRHLNRRKKVGVELKVKNHFFTIGTPNNETIKKTFSFGIQGFYSFLFQQDKSIDINLGIFRNNIQYKSTVNNSSLASNDDYNLATSTGIWIGARFQGLW